MRRPSTAAVFCRVVDNYGDAGVALRLARQLAHDHALAVTLYVDDLATLLRIAPDVDPSGDRRQDDVRIVPLAAAASDPPADVAIEAFGGGLPDAYLDAMERAAHTTAWLHLEYLSAEAWIDDAHGLPSPPPRRRLRRWFYFPGFTERSGGLLRERDLLAQRDAHLAGIDSHALVWRAAGVDALPADALTVSLFSYPTPAAEALLGELVRGPAPTVCIVPEGVVAESIARVVGTPRRAPDVARAGALTLVVAPFVSQRDFDARLWSCAFNFVRGEDSFVRAQWAARPFVWHIYRQAEEAHRAKLAAFLDRYLEGAPEAAARSIRSLWQAWNGDDGDATVIAWREARAALPHLAAHARAWSTGLATQADLATRLVALVAERL
jgi:uncharacterized repeat protein (TIGR03837 family)